MRVGEQAVTDHQLRRTGAGDHRLIVARGVDAEVLDDVMAVG